MKKQCNANMGYWDGKACEGAPEGLGSRSVISEKVPRGPGGLSQDLSCRAGQGLRHPLVFRSKYSFPLLTFPYLGVSR